MFSYDHSGKMSGRGIEATLNLNILDKEDYGWNSQINYTSNENIVDELAPGLQRLFVHGFKSSAGTYLVAGNQYGAILEVLSLELVQVVLMTMS